MLHRLIRGPGGAGCAAARGARKLSWRASRVVTVAACAAIASGVIVPAASAAPGDLTYADCAGYPAGCNLALFFPGSVGKTLGVAVNGLTVYTVAPAAISQFAMNSAGKLSWAACYSNQAPLFCASSPPAGGNAVTVNAAGTWLYTTTADALGGAVSQYRIDAAGDLTYAGCYGRLLATSCAPTGPAGAVDGAHGVAVTADGTQLYVAASAGNVVSHFTVGKAGSLTPAGCIGDLVGCVATSPPGALDGVDSVSVTPDGRHLYAASRKTSTLTYFTIDGTGNLVFSGCTGALQGCYPNSALGGVNSLAVSPSGTHLYATAGTGNAISHFRIDSTGKPVFAGCTGDHPGCAPTTPAGALDGAFGVAISWAGGDAYAISWWGSYGAISHFKFDAAGNPVFISCAGDYPGCATTTVKGVTDGADAVAVSADGANLYATAYLANAVSHFTIAPFF